MPLFQTPRFFLGLGKGDTAVTRNFPVRITFSHILVPFSFLWRPLPY